MIPHTEMSAACRRVPQDTRADPAPSAIEGTCCSHNEYRLCSGTLSVSPYHYSQSFFRRLSPAKDLMGREQNVTANGVSPEARGVAEFRILLLFPGCRNGAATSQIRRTRRLHGNDVKIDELSRVQRGLLARYVDSMIRGHYQHPSQQFCSSALNWQTLTGPSPKLLSNPGRYARCRYWRICVSRSAQRHERLYLHATK